MKYQIMPPLSTEEKEALRASIEMEGIRDPIIVDEEGNILDGYTRYEIASDAPRKVIKGLTEGEKLAFALRSNLGRRNLSLAQKKDLLKKQREIARQLREENPTKNTNARVGAMLGVSEATISRWLDDSKQNTSNLQAQDTCTPTMQ